MWLCELWCVCLVVAYWILQFVVFAISWWELRCVRAPVACLMLHIWNRVFVSCECPCMFCCLSFWVLTSPSVVLVACRFTFGELILPCPKVAAMTMTVVEFSWRFQHLRNPTCSCAWIMNGRSTIGSFDHFLERQFSACYVSFGAWSEHERRQLPTWSQNM